jgi:hypothetical protein
VCAISPATAACEVFMRRSVLKNLMKLDEYIYRSARRHRRQHEPWRPWRRRSGPLGGALRGVERARFRSPPIDALLMARAAGAAAMWSLRRRAQCHPRRRAGPRRVPALTGWGDGPRPTHRAHRDGSGKRWTRARCATADRRAARLGSAAARAAPRQRGCSRGSGEDILVVSRGTQGRRRLQQRERRWLARQASCSRSTDRIPWDRLYPVRTCPASSSTARSMVPVTATANCHLRPGCRPLAAGSFAVCSGAV